MKRILLYGFMGLVLAGSYLLRTPQAETKIIEVIPAGYIDSKSTTFQDNYIDIREVQYFEIVDGLRLYMKDGTVYQWD